MRFSPVFFVAGILHVFRRIRPVAAILLAWKQKSRLLCNFFAITDSFPSPQCGNGSFLRLISCAFALRSATGGHATIPNRKKVAIWAAILFFRFPERARAAWKRRTRNRLPYGKESGAMGRAWWASREIQGSAWGQVWLPPLIDETRYCVPHPPPCLPYRCSMPAHHYHPQLHSILLWRGLPSWQNWSTLKKPVVQGVSLKELARVSALGD